MNGMGAKKYEYVLDLFKGICEINDYELLINDDKIKGKRCYFSNNFTYEVHADGINNSYVDAEIINIGVKYADILGFKNIKVYVHSKSDNEYFNLLLENLESIEIDYSIDNDIKLGDSLISYNIVSEDIVIASGECGELSYLRFDYDKISKYIDDSIIKLQVVDVYINANGENADALIIGTMLKDAGYKTYIDYDGKANISSNYEIVIDKKLLEGYKVKLHDLRTNETKNIDINNLVDELDINY